MTPKIFILDVDGVMTTGQFFYSEEGKVMKVFGADDSDALKLLKPYIDILFLTADKRGYPITKKRIVDDMGYPLFLVAGTKERVEWIKTLNKLKLDEVIYMGDGFFDHYVMKEVGYSIATTDADENTKLYADYITKRTGGNRAVAEACIHILERFFNVFDRTK